MITTKTFSPQLPMKNRSVALPGFCRPFNIHLGSQGAFVGTNSTLTCIHENVSKLKKAQFPLSRSLALSLSQV